MESKSILRTPGGQLVGLHPAVCHAVIAAIRQADAGMGGEDRKEDLPDHCGGWLELLSSQIPCVQNSGTDYKIPGSRGELVQLLATCEAFLDVVEPHVHVDILGVDVATCRRLLSTIQTEVGLTAETETVEDIAPVYEGLISILARETRLTVDPESILRKTRRDNLLAYLADVKLFLDILEGKEKPAPSDE